MKKSLTQSANIIRGFLAEKNLQIGHRTALELSARIEGHKDLHQAQACTKPTPVTRVSDEEGVTLSSSFCATERGNTLLTTEDGAMVAWIRLSDGFMLEISDTPGNYPRLQVGITSNTPFELKAHILRLQTQGWVVQKDNLLSEEQSRLFQSTLAQRQSKFAESLAVEIEVAINNHSENTGEDHLCADVEDLRFELQKLGANPSGTLLQMIRELSVENFFIFVDSFNDPNEGCDSTPRILASDNHKLREIAAEVTNLARILPANEPSIGGGTPNPITALIIAAANKAYPDGLLAEHYDEKVNLTIKGRGDTLAEFVVTEIRECSDGCPNQQSAANECARAISRAVDELQGVVSAIEKLA